MNLKKESLKRLSRKETFGMSANTKKMIIDEDVFSPSSER